MKIIGIILLVIFAIYCVGRIAANESAKSNPPASCVLFGGQWNFWDGWKCQ